ncbi:MAG: NUDIX hydrolase [Bilifractor sp.]|jgi:coenzyme A diphosphatase NUDT7
MKTEQIMEQMKNRRMETIRPDSERQAAVLMPLLEVDGEAGLLFEIRNRDLPQGGEICFPGGAVEADERPEKTAVRETMEELLLPRGQVRILSPMFEMSGPGGTWISSYLGCLCGYEGTFSKDEVEEVFSVPVRWFLENPPVVSHVKLGMEESADFPWELIPGGKNYPLRKFPKAYYFYPTDHGVIWGMTAELIFHFTQAIETGQR